ncbi:MAG: acyl-ACP--UDP-N-acetylglucosamine O-acyltransferase [Phycisphaeraceae bacterium]|nr:acyl-ACP--UDP-N-acetylglucosamine O-acyltransferase [Phycisphaeraceae bacterium]
MAKIHPSAVIHGDVQLADDVVIGPNCVLFGPISLGAGTHLIAGAYLHGPLQMGENNALYPGVAIGFAPQDLGFDRSQPGSGCVIGSGNTFREHVTIHRGKTAHPTRVGNDNYWMACSHAGHDAVVGNRCIFANSTLLAGHVEIADRVITGGNTAIHQFVRLGRGVFMSGGVSLSLDAPPFVMVTGTNIGGSLNIIGMRRSGMPPEEIDAARWCYRTAIRNNLPRANALAKLRERAGIPIVDEYIRFIESAKRPLIHSTGRAVRGTHAAASSDSASARQDAAGADGAPAAPEWDGADE